jgi:hypothetical protein
MSNYPSASTRQFEALAIVFVCNRLSGVGDPDYISPHISQNRLLTAFDTTLGAPRYKNLRAVTIYVTGIDVNVGKADLRLDVEKLMPRLRAKGILKTEVLGRYNEDEDFSASSVKYEAGAVTSM